MQISHRLQVSAEALAEMLIHGVISVDTAMALMESGLDLDALVALAALTDVECDRLLEAGDEPVFDTTPAGLAYLGDDDDSIH